MSGTHTRRSVVELTVLAMVALLAVLGLQRAYASTVGGFELDGDIAAAGGTDWSNAGGQPVALDGVGHADNTILYGGSKENNPAGWRVHGSGQSPGKDDIGYVYAFSHSDAGHQWGFVGFERAASNGTTLVTLELNQKHNKTNSHGVSIPDRSDGDLRLTVVQQGNGPFTVGNTLDDYQSGSWVTLSSPPGIVVGQSNTSAITPINSGDPIRT